MSYTYIKLQGTLSDALYQASSAFAVSFHKGKKLGISVENISHHNVPMFNKIKQFCTLNCPNEFYEEHMTADSLITQIPNCKRNIQMFGAFKNKDHFFEYRNQLYNQYHFEIIPELENSTYVYIDDTFLENNKYFIELLNELVEDNKQIQLVIHSSEYSSIRERLEEIYKGITHVSFLDNVSDYEKLCIMINCKQGGYSTGKELGFWADFFQKDEQTIIGFNTVCKSKKWDFVDKIMYINLKESSYRKKYMEKLLHGIPNEKIIRFDAIKDKKGYIGCTKSHIECLILAKKNNWKNVMIIEDDIRLAKNAKEAMATLHALVKQPYDVILLGSVYTKMNRETYRLYQGQSTAGYIVANHYFDILLNNFKEGLYNLLKTDIYSDFSIDQYWKTLQETDNWYFCYPGLIIQKPSYSIIEKKYVDYLEYFDNVTFMNDTLISELSKFELCTELIGGFGNQLFMIFNLIALSKKYNKKIKFYYDDKYINSYLKERNTLRKSSSNYEIFKNIDFTKLDESLLTSFNTYSELEYKYNEIILETDKKYSIQGYFQSYKYFWEYKDEIKQYLCIDSDKIKEIKKQFYSYEKPILSIHMRLGDYTKLQDYYTIPLIEYYKNALANYNLDEYQIILFSDDIEAASEKIKELNISFIKADELYKSDEEQFYMLCLSKIRICSNSTYSLMSCYLNDMYNFVENPEYTFPHKWFARLGPSYHIHDLIPIKNNRYKIDYYDYKDRRFKNDIEYLFIIYSCKKNIEKADYLYSLINDKLKKSKVYIIYGDNQLETNYKIIDDKYLVLRCGDDYDNLCQKTITIMKTVSIIFPDIKGIFKCNDDMVPNIKLMKEIISLIDHDISINYLGKKVSIKQEYFTKDHYNKCFDEKDKILNMPIKLDTLEWITGSLYYVSNKSINILKNIDYSKYYFEDYMVSDILIKNNIQLYDISTYTDQNYMSNVIQNINSSKFLFIYLYAGLGNQLFMVSAAYNIAKQNNMILVLVSKENGANTEQNKFDDYLGTIFSNFYHIYSQNLDLSTLNIYYEKKCFDYNPFIITENKNYLLRGFFQHKKYLENDIEILNLFKNDELCNNLLLKYPLLTNSYFIHFRRGDYVNNPLFAIDIDSYYERALNYILEKEKDAHFFILSDDIESVKKYVEKFTINKTFIENMDTLESLYIMSMCKKGGICANSTFSGWGSKLNTNKDKTVIVPKNWINLGYEYEIPFEYTIAF